MRGPRRRPLVRRLGKAGVTSLEFAIVAVIFFTVVISGIDLGRYFFVAESLRTFASEAARQGLIYKTWQPQDETCPCANPSGGNDLNTIVPILDPALLTLKVTQTSPTAATAYTVTVTATYQFTAIVPVWAALSGTMRDTAQFSY
jgi:Flp pilus assembly protein TadG